MLTVKLPNLFVYIYIYAVSKIKSYEFAVHLFAKVEKKTAQKY